MLFRHVGQRMDNSWFDWLDWIHMKIKATDPIATARRTRYSVRVWLTEWSAEVGCWYVDP